MGIKPLLLSLLGVSALGGVAVGGYYAFNKSNQKEDKSKASAQVTESAPAQTPLTTAPTTTTRTDATSSTSNTGSSGASSTTVSSSSSGAGVQQPSK